MEQTNETDKRTAILQATLDLIAEHGFHGTPVSMIAKKSGVSTGIIYHYFMGKEAIIHALYQQVKANFGKAMLNGVVAETEWLERFKQVWLNAYHFFVKHPKETLFLEQYDNSPYYHAWEERQLDDYFLTLTQMMKADIDKGLIKPLPFEAIYALTLGVALVLAKRQIATKFMLDEDTLQTVAKASCLAVGR